MGRSGGDFLKAPKREKPNGGGYDVQNIGRAVAAHNEKSEDEKRQMARPCGSEGRK